MSERMLESEWQRRLQVHLSSVGFRVFRNTIGFDREKKIRYGLSKGSADLVGWFSHNGIAVFVGIEVKMPAGRIKEDQQRWLDVVNSAGGFATIARAPTSNPTDDDAERVAGEIREQCMTRFSWEDTPPTTPSMGSPSSQ